MPEAAVLPLVHWESFYVIVGSSGAALTGLQFVVMALVAEAETPSTPQAVAAFGTPTIVHFCAVLLISAILSAPWLTLLGPSLAVGVCGVTGITYSGIVVRRALRTTGYDPVLEDWLWHAVFPLLVYGVLLFAAVMLARHTVPMLFTIGLCALLLLFIGIHNAWDTATYVAVGRRHAASETR